MTEGNDFVLLVEDTLTQAMLYQHSFEKAGINTVVAKSSAKALEKIQESKPLVILSDVNMPEMNGYDLCKKIKEDDTTSDIMFVLISSVLNSEEIFEIVNSGADDFILKSLSPEAITEHLLWDMEQAREKLTAVQSDSLFEGKVLQNGSLKSLRTHKETSARLVFSLFNTLCKITKSV